MKVTVELMKKGWWRFTITTSDGKEFRSRKNLYESPAIIIVRNFPYVMFSSFYEDTHPEITPYALYQMLDVSMIFPLSVNWENRID